MVGDLRKKVLGRRIKAVRLGAPKILRGVSPAYFQKNLSGRKILAVRRVAKNIFFELSGGYLLAVHPKMTGHFLYGRFSPSAVKHARLEFDLDSGLTLYFNDVRKFARVMFGSAEKIKNAKEFSLLGPDPLDKNFTLSILSGLLKSKKGRIKSVLLDQKVIAGIGNIYADEILFSAKIHPLTPAYRLAPAELKRIFEATKKILKKAVALRGSSLSDFFDLAGRKGFYGPRRLVYKRPGQPCYRCQTLIKRIRIGGRSAHFCPKCQRI